MNALTIQLHTPPSVVHLLPRIAYTVALINAHPYSRHYGARWLLNESSPGENAVHLAYGDSRPLSFYLPLDRALLGADPDSLPPVYGGIFSTPEGQELLATGTQAFKGRGDWTSGAQFGFDWLATLFFHWSRMEEYHPPRESLNEHGTVRGTALFLPRHHRHHTPVVEHILQALYRTLAPGHPVYPAPTAFSWTHDVDGLRLFTTPLRFLRFLGGAAWRHKTLKGWPGMMRAFSAVRWKGQPDPADTFDWLLQLSPIGEKRIYFGTGSVSQYDDFPDLNTPRMKAIWQMAREQGYTPGLHPSYTTWKNAELFAAEKNTVSQWTGEKIVHSRQHYLHFAFPETADILESQGIAFDGTLGYRDLAGFRAGTGFPWRLYNFKNKKAYSWTALPLVVMDTALVHEARLRKMHPADLFRQFVAQNARGTAICLNLHNTFFFEQALHGFDFKSQLEKIATRL